MIYILKKIQQKYSLDTRERIRFGQVINSERGVYNREKHMFIQCHRTFYNNLFLVNRERQNYLRKKSLTSLWLIKVICIIQNLPPTPSPFYKLGHAAIECSTLLPYKI